MSYADRLRAPLTMIWNALRSCLIRILQAGPIPRHIAFIMDGNRRFATKQGLQSISGHQQGYLKVLYIPTVFATKYVHTLGISNTRCLAQLLDALQWCLDLGVEAITVYAFSIDNFRRETQEVDALMTLAEEKLLDLLNVGTCRPAGCFSAEIGVLSWP